MGTKTQTNTMPAAQQEFLEGTVIPFAEDFLAQDFNPYLGQRVEGMTPLGQQALAGYGGLDMGAPLFSQAADAYGGLATMQAPTTQAAQIGNVGSLASANLSQYMNPFQDAVIDRSLSRLADFQDQDLNTLGAQAEAANAFGGSRQGVQEALTREKYGQQASDLITNANLRNFEQAQRAASSDIAREQDRVLRQAAFDQQAGLTNTQAMLDAARLRGAGAAGLQNVARNQTGTNIAGLGAMASAAEAERRLGQMDRDFALEQFLAEQNFPLTQFGVLTGASGAFPSYSGTTTTRDPLGTFGSLLTGIGKFGTGFPKFFSDVRLKENIVSAGKISDVNFYRWDWNDKAKEIGVDKHPTFGVMAQELEKSYPEYVLTGQDGYRRVNYIGLYAQLGV